MIQKMKIHKIWILSKRLLKGNAVKQTNKQTKKPKMYGFYVQ